MGKCGVVALVLAGWVCSVASGQGKRPRPEGPWPELAKKCQLDDQTIARLGRDRVVVTDQAFKQVFSPYVSSWLPVFITSDSILNGFHVLFEETLARLEAAQAGRLKHVMAALGKALPNVGEKLTGDRALIAASGKRAGIVVAVAEALLGETPSDLPPDVALIVREEVERVKAAKGQALPAWLGLPEPDFLAIDYGRFQPRGFYTRSETLQRYFRAVAWLQAIPFRIRHDQEMLAALMLGCAVEQLRDTGDLDQSKDATRLFEVFRKIIGLGDDWDAFTSGPFGGSEPEDRLDFVVTTRSLAALRRDLLAQARRTGSSSRINDQVCFPPAGDPLVESIGFRVLAACRTPGGMLFARTTDLRDPKLDGRRMPTGLEMGALLGSGYAMAQLDRFPRVQAIIREMASLREGSSLLVDYLRCLEALLDEPEPDAPAFLRGRAWQVKQLNTALGGWVQMRHALVLWSKWSATFCAIGSTPVGFVEPEPEFFGRLCRLIRRARRLFEETGACGPEGGDTDRVFGRRLDIRDTWDQLESLCQRLEVLAHKQLRGVPFSPVDESFLLNYGKRLSRVLFHFGEAHLTPRDDAPRVADVHTDPDQGLVLLVGIARPRALYVLYPWQGRDVLCLGAVLPYYELAGPARLTDAEWKARLDGPDRPASPTWLSPLVGPGGLGKPVVRER